MRQKARKPIRDASGIYHYRRRVPEDVRAILRLLDARDGGRGKKQDKLEEKKRLGRDAKQAQAAFEKHDLEVERRWKQLRSGVVARLTVVQREALAGEIYQRWINGYPPDYFHSQVSASFALGTMQELDGEMPRQLPRQDDASDEQVMENMHGWHVDETIARKGLILTDAERWQVVIAAQRAAKHACRVVIARFNGDLRPDPDASKYPEWPDPQTTTLIGLHGMWVKHRQPQEETERGYLSCIQDLVAFVGKDDVPTLSTADVRKWCNGLRLQKDLSGIRVRDGYLAAVNAVLNSAVATGLIASNPAAAVRIEVQKSEETREKDLNDAEVYAILRATRLAHDGKASEDVHNVRKWVPWLCAYTGARVAEITRLESRHIITEQGVVGIHIERSKTGRMRKIPVHKDLLEQGFLAFVDSRSGRPLFFDERKLEAGKLKIHKTRAEGLAEWIRTIPGMSDGRVAPSHGWRHRFRTECRRIHMDREIRNYLQGHAVENIGESYGHVPLDVSAPWMEMFPRFDVDGDHLVVDRPFDVSAMMRAADRLRELGARTPPMPAPETTGHGSSSGRS